MDKPLQSPLQVFRLILIRASRQCMDNSNSNSNTTIKAHIATINTPSNTINNTSLKMRDSPLLPTTLSSSYMGNKASWVRKVKVKA